VTGEEGPRQLARRRLARIALGYFAAVAVIVAVNVLTHGPTWWYFAAAGVGAGLGLHALALRGGT
jgi:hypothetical protein